MVLLALRSYAKGFPDRFCSWLRCSANLPLYSRVAHLKLSQDLDVDGHHAGWLHLLRQFSSVQTLHIAHELAGHIALALEDVTGEMVSEVLPALDLIFLVGQPVSSIDKFIAARRLSGHPVTIADTEMKFDKRLKSYISE